MTPGEILVTRARDLTTEPARILAVLEANDALSAILNAANGRIGFTSEAYEPSLGAEPAMTITIDGLEVRIGVERRFFDDDELVYVGGRSIASRPCYVAHRPFGAYSDFRRTFVTGDEFAAALANVLHLAAAQRREAARKIQSRAGSCLVSSDDNAFLTQYNAMIGRTTPDQEKPE